ncbi:FG-GAP-like repeat-containing protein [Deinococcus yavapaiensis]|uniref:VCBS repeat protein n=1 Tax=Deinococcus yavapaiensis KR-236 TaxID=694435 RepID=A0A318SC67_9DEIO|nr:FG-GAP-like repeat-containing protein [Deinococcus yavapaiensis]PYE53910.1 VCBS repeat protein [Deinococcus yavapaiensis KR-236]
MNRSTSLKSSLIVLLCAGLASAQERVGSHSQPLTVKNVRLWTQNGNTVPVCWETPGYAREKAIVQAAVISTWQWHAKVNFTGWGACPTGGIGGSATVKQVRVRITAQGTANAGAGGSARLGMDALSSANDNDPGVSLSFNPDGSANRGRVEYVGVHEFGHVLGFVHEQDTPGNPEGPARCASPGNEPNSTSLTAYDRDSIMNYCNRDGNMTGNLTDIDIQGVQAVYGVRFPNLAARNTCASALTRQTASVAWAWNDGSNQASIALFPSSGTKFTDRAVLSSRDGGWGDSVKWFAGDFNADGKSDIGAAWNNGGHATLTMRLSTGSALRQAHWLIEAGGWIDTTIYLPGDFNGDGKTDVAGVWNNAGKVSIAVFLSDGQKFTGWTQWSDRDGGWAETVKWFAGDFDGDGKSDIGAAWNNGGRTTLTVRASTGRSFVAAHWLTDAGRWTDTAAFVAGDFNGDGRADVARLWNDLGNNSTDVTLSNGRAFQGASAWSTRDGGWIQGAAVKWIAGDFNGDGKTDIGAAWNDQQLNTLTIRASTGSSFAPAHWAVRAGGWRDSAAWCAGHFQ